VGEREGKEQTFGLLRAIASDCTSDGLHLALDSFASAFNVSRGFGFVQFGISTSLVLVAMGLHGVVAESTSDL
jgi:hypothetical protein